jgi:tetratricopeptide (TPR) repeat protein
LKQYDSAFSYFVHAYKTDSTQLAELLNIELCCRIAGKDSMSLHYDSLILKKAPEQTKTILHYISIAHNNIGLHYLRNNKLKKALKEFNIALSIDSNMVAAIKNIALVYDKIGGKAMAIKYEDDNNRKLKKQ